MKLISNRATRQQVQQQSRTLGELGLALDSQSRAISGLADNQKVLHDGMLAFVTKGFWARLRWLVTGR